MFVPMRSMKSADFPPQDEPYSPLFCGGRRVGYACGDAPVRSGRTRSPLRSSLAVGVLYTNVQFSVLGPARLFMDGTVVGAGQPRRRVVLASLLLRSGSPVSLRTWIDDV